MKCKLHTLVMLEYCYWWRGSWLLEKWSHRVCRRVLFLFFLRCRFQGEGQGLLSTTDMLLFLQIRPLTTLFLSARKTYYIDCLKIDLDSLQGRGNHGSCLTLVFSWKMRNVILPHNSENQNYFLSYSTAYKMKIELQR